MNESLFTFNINLAANVTDVDRQVLLLGPEVVAPNAVVDHRVI